MRQTGARTVGRAKSHWLLCSILFGCFLLNWFNSAYCYYHYWRRYRHVKTNISPISKFPRSIYLFNNLFCFYFFIFLFNGMEIETMSFSTNHNLVVVIITIINGYYRQQLLQSWHSIKSAMRIVLCFDSLFYLLWWYTHTHSLSFSCSCSYRIQS